MREIQEVPGKVTIKTAFRDYFKGYFDFMGRSTRAGYWWVMGIIILILYIPLFILLGQWLWQNEPLSFFHTFKESVPSRILRTDTTGDV